MSRSFDPSIYLVTDTALCAPREVAEVVASAVAGGATMLQIREKEMSARELLALTADAAGAVDGRATLLIDDRVDVFLAARAQGVAVDGVHIGQSDLPPETTRRLVGPDAIIGLSAATPQEIAAANAMSPDIVDYIGIGAVHATATKADHPAPLGVQGFARLAAACTLPVVAIGGVKAPDVRPLRAAGAAGIAVVSAICAAADPRSAAEELVREWES